MRKELKKIADQIVKNGGFETSGNLYHPLPFPEFDHLITSASSKSAYYKWDIIEESLKNKNGMKNRKVLDVGANAGFYSFKFAKLGAKVQAFEPHMHYAEIGEQIAEITGLDVQWFNKILEYKDIQDKQFDIALMLSVFQWMSKGNENLEQASGLLSEIGQRAKLLFFELGCNEGKSAIHTTERPISWILNLLKEHTPYPYCSYLGRSKAWGNNKRFLFVCYYNKDDVSLNLKQRLITWIIENIV